VRKRLALIWSLGGAGIIALMVLGVAFGSTVLPLEQIWQSLAAPLSPELASDVPMAVQRIVLELRLPRVILAACVGAGLAVIGALLQTTTRNDLADPFLFGLSSGAAAGAVAVISHFGDRLGAWTTPLAAFAGAMLSAGAVLALVTNQRERGPEKLIIAGLAVSFLFGAITSYLVFAGDQRAAHSVFFWSLGGLGLANWSNILLALLGIVIALGTGIVFHRKLDGLLAGEETASSLGINVPRLRLVIFFLSACATAAFVALAGVIGFVGLMVPHMAKALVGVRHRPMIITTAILGALLLLSGDLISRLILAPQELPVGIVTAAAGAVFVLAMIVRRP
jgi:iron complex transport system permease protein